MTVVHRVIGTIIVVLFLVLIVAGPVLRVTGRRETPVALWAVQHWTENLLIVQTLTGIVLLVLGRGVGDWWHYLYGSLFPLIAVIGGRLAAVRRETRAYVGLAWGSFFAFALTLRAIQTACGDALADVVRCVTP